MKWKFAPACTLCTCYSCSFLLIPFLSACSLCIIHLLMSFTPFCALQLCLYLSCPLHLFVPGSTQSTLLVPFTLFMPACTLCICLHPLVPFVSALYHLPLLMPTCTLCTYACAFVLTCTCSYLKLHINVTF